MNRTFQALTLAFVAAVFGLATWAQDFEKGLDAARAGDFVGALEEWRPLAEQGNIDAQLNLGLMYHNGEGVPQDYTEAAKWYRLAAEQGDTIAQFNLGVMYSQGQSVPRNYAEALSWFRLAAEQGMMEAQHSV